MGRKTVICWLEKSPLCSVGWEQKASLWLAIYFPPVYVHFSVEESSIGNGMNTFLSSLYARITPDLVITPRFGPSIHSLKGKTKKMENCFRNQWLERQFFVLTLLELLRAFERICLFVSFYISLISVKKFRRLYWSYKATRLGYINRVF